MAIQVAQMIVPYDSTNPLHICCVVRRREHVSAVKSCCRAVPDSDRAKAHDRQGLGMTLNREIGCAAPVATRRELE